MGREYNSGVDQQIFGRCGYLKGRINGIEDGLGDSDPKRKVHLAIKNKSPLSLRNC